MLTPLKDLGQLIAETDLTNVHANKFPQCPHPATHQCGTQSIDIMLASPWFVNAITAAYILPFGVPITMPGDHCTLGINQDTQILFSNKSPHHQDLPRCEEFNPTYPNGTTFL